MAPVWVLPTVIGISFIISLISQFVHYKLTDQDLIKKKRARMKELQKKLTPKSSKAEITKTQTELMSINSELMKHTMKPTMYTFLPMLIMFWVMNMTFQPYGDLLQLPVSLPLFGPAISWLGTYIICSFVFTLTLKPLISKLGEKRNAKTRS